MSFYGKLQKIPLDLYEECDYRTAKESNFGVIKGYYEYNFDAIKSVNAFFLDFEDDMEENGMEKFVAMITGMLFQINKGNVERDLTFGIYHDIIDFETGEYDNLFTSEDLLYIRKDIKIIKDYMFEHPELLKN